MRVCEEFQDAPAPFTRNRPRGPASGWSRSGSVDPLQQRQVVGRVAVEQLMRRRSPPSWWPRRLRATASTRTTLPSRKVGTPCAMRPVMVPGHCRRAPARTASRCCRRRTRVAIGRVTNSLVAVTTATSVAAGLQVAVAPASSALLVQLGLDHLAHELRVAPRPRLPRADARASAEVAKAIVGTRPSSVCRPGTAGRRTSLRCGARHAASSTQPRLHHEFGEGVVGVQLGSKRARRGQTASSFIVTPPPRCNHLLQQRHRHRAACSASEKRSSWLEQRHQRA